MTRKYSCFPQVDVHPIGQRVFLLSYNQHAFGENLVTLPNTQQPQRKPLSSSPGWYLVIIESDQLYHLTKPLSSSPGWYLVTLQSTQLYHLTKPLSSSPGRYLVTIQSTQLYHLTKPLSSSPGWYLVIIESAQLYHLTNRTTESQSTKYEEQKNKTALIASFCC